MTLFVYSQVHGSLEIFGLLLLGLELGIRMKWLGLRVYFTHPRTVLKVMPLKILNLNRLLLASVWENLL